ncbi:MAG: NAD-dependent DNA ligase LigA [Dehalococcoidia bacterium]|nr:MAG: NAD-dependent DNA ligase LigA [Chloroflexota bacterium]|tara:strand:- start:376 stop:2403 length:2028 start_codon:yes stop_codon:yes gene_type:complete
MTSKEINNRIEILRKQLNQANKEYYIEETPSLSDFEYDKKFFELLDLEKNNTDLITPESPTQRVGSNPALEFNQVTHSIPMLSLSNVFGKEEMEDWIEKTSKAADQDIFPLVCELKIDGLAVSVKYENGKLFQGATRGNGIEGEDITTNVKTIRSIPLSIEERNGIEIRGEIYFPNSKFNRFNSERENEGLSTFSNPRNAASGSVRQLDSKETAKRPLDIFFYSLYDLDGEEIFNSQYESLIKMKQLGFRTNKNYKKINNKKELFEYIEQWSKSRFDLDYGTDGIVIKIDNTEIQNKLGSTGRIPKWATAYKFPPEVVETIIKKINFNIGRTGVLTPWAELEPVYIDGVKISRATLHNRDEIERKDIREKDLVELQRAGEVIPQILKVSGKNKRDSDSGKFTFPKFCPDPCNSELLHSKDEVSVRCIDSSCPNKFERLLQYFASKNCMDIDGLGSRICSVLFKEKLITSLDEIYLLKNRKSELLEIEGFGDLSVDKLLESIENSKEKSFSNLLTSFGIEGVGVEIADLITEKISNLIEIKEYSKDQIDFREFLENIDGIGPIVAEKIIIWFKEDKNIDLIEKFINLNIGTKIVEKQSISSSLDGKIFVVTGSFDKYSRNDIETIIKDNGGKVTSKVSSKTDYLILGENPGSKLDDAQNNNVEIIDISDLLNLISS